MLLYSWRRMPRRRSETYSKFLESETVTKTFSTTRGSLLGNCFQMPRKLQKSNHPKDDEIIAFHARNFTVT